MKIYLLIFLFAIIYNLLQAQTRKIFVKESLVYSYNTTGYNPGVIIIKKGGDSIIVTKHPLKDDYSTQYWCSI